MALSIFVLVLDKECVYSVVVPADRRVELSFFFLCAECTASIQQDISHSH